ncbi:DUF3376 domain-containing protein [Kitasatospora sp. NPDC096204]|uniref:DUF3376 domain-containing protein n=1 Tax=Kitasatospora sp. NPDC096204 TaxID=3364094 RepID=UPI00381C0E8E
MIATSSPVDIGPSLLLRCRAAAQNPGVETPVGVGLNVSPGSLSLTSVRMSSTAGRRRRPERRRRTGPVLCQKRRGHRRRLPGGRGGHQGLHTAVGDHRFPHPGLPVPATRAGHGQAAVRPDRLKRLGDRKLYGIRYGHFGAFIDRERRKSDFAWGRLDAANHLLPLMIDGPAAREGREREPHQAILDAEHRSSPVGPGPADAGDAGIP